MTRASQVPTCEIPWRDLTATLFFSEKVKMLPCGFLDWGDIMCMLPIHFHGHDLMISIFHGFDFGLQYPIIRTTHKQVAPNKQLTNFLWGGVLIIEVLPQVLKRSTVERTQQSCLTLQVLRRVLPNSMADQWNKRQKDQRLLQPGLLLLSVNGEEDHEEIMSLDSSN